MLITLMVALIIVSRNIILQTSITKRQNSKIMMGVFAVLVAIAAPLQFANSALADRYDDQIRAIQREVNQLQSKAGELNQRARTLQDAVNALANEKNMIQAQIDLSQAKYDKLINDIELNTIKLADTQNALGKILANLYVDDRISPLEMLASSKNVGEYMDKQEYRSAVSEQLDKAIASIKQLKIQLEKDKKEVERILQDLKVQREAKAAKEAEQQQLLDQTRGEEAVYQSMVSEKNASINALRAQQAAEIRARAASSGYTALPGDPNRGGYPAKWANAPMNAYVDDWGMYSRQCVSYAAYKVASTYGNMPYWGGRGNANQWANNARAAGIPTSPVPKAGTVGVQYSGAYGHVAWVESVNSDGTLTISQFNANWSGEYSRWIVDRSFFNEYVYFGG